MNSGKNAVWTVWMIFGTILFAMQPPGMADSAQLCSSSMTHTSPDVRFTDNGDGTVDDMKTGLMWAKCADGLSGADCSLGSAATYTWDKALEAAAASNLAGYTDWALPNIKELASLVEQACSSPAINTRIFPNVPISTLRGFWSATPCAVFPSEAWYVSFTFGESGAFDTPYHRDYPRHIRLVRDRN